MTFWLLDRVASTWMQDTKLCNLKEITCCKKENKCLSHLRGIVVVVRRA